MGYKLNTFANGFGLWRCQVTFDFPGVGNSPEAEALKYLALAAAKRAIRKEIVSRESKQIRRLSYEIVDNKIDNMNRLHSFTVGERDV